MESLWIFAAVIFAQTVVSVLSLTADGEMRTGATGQCGYGREFYNNGAVWLDGQYCTSKLECRNGQIYRYANRCPAHSFCEDGQCRCDKDSYRTEAKTEDGLLASCRKTKECSDGTKSHKSGTAWLQTDCQKKFSCHDGYTASSKHNCPRFSHCDNGKCVCDQDFKVKGMTSSGLLDNCQRSSARDDACEHGHDFYKEGEVWPIGRWCKHKLECRGGIAYRRFYRCPVNSYCFYGECKCRQGFGYRGKTNEGLLHRCRQEKVCMDGDKTLKSGSAWLQPDCQMKLKCIDGSIFVNKNRCPGNSHCQQGQCVCNQGFRIKEKDNDGFLARCQQTNANEKCEYAHEFYQDGAVWTVGKNCGTKMECREGVVYRHFYRCPSNSFCDYGQCRCRKDFIAKGRTTEGLLTRCRPAKTCSDGGTTYKTGSKWIQGDCQMKMSCGDGYIWKRPHRCPRHSHCVNGQCFCDEGFKVKGRTSSGLLDSCQRTSASDDQCTYHRHTYNNRDVWLIGRYCKHKMECRDGISYRHFFRCPADSYCHQAQCKCREGFIAKGKTSEGLLRKCRKSRECLDEGITYESGTSWLQNDCQNKANCHDGRVTRSKFNCPDNSQCLNSQCVTETIVGN